MSRPFPTDDPFLRGNYAPIACESDAHDLVVEGEIPRELAGTYYRNGPNPQYAPRGRYHWFDGDGMIHALRIRDGHARYKNRWVRTARFSLERAAGEALFGGIGDMGNNDPRVGANMTSGNTANTNIVWHAGRLLALWEAGPPHALDPRTLETYGPHHFDGKLVGPMTAHPKLDAETGEMLFFGYSPIPPFLRYHVADRNGRLVRTEEIEVPVATMMHDFITTRDYVVFMVCPATFRLENIEKGLPPIGWEPELGTRIGVMPRDGGSKDVVWFSADPCYVFHPMNAWNDGGKVVADVCRYGKVPLFGDGAEGIGARLTRWTLDLASGTLKEEQLDDAATEFPRFDERRVGLRYRHGYAAGAIAGEEERASFDSIVHYDLETGARNLHRLASGDVAGEPVFVPRAADAPEGDGFLLSIVYRGADNRSDLLILDAKDVAAKPLATVVLPHRVPFGFHGNWAPGV